MVQFAVVPLPRAAVEVVVVVVVVGFSALIRFFVPWVERLPAYKAPDFGPTDSESRLRTTGSDTRTVALDRNLEPS